MKPDYSKIRAAGANVAAAKARLEAKRATPTRSPGDHDLETSVDITDETRAVMEAEAEERRAIRAADEVHPLAPGGALDGDPANDAPASKSRVKVEWIGTADIFAPLPPLVQCVPGLFIGRGRPTMIAGYGYSKKTLSAQSLALSVASGSKVWGQFYTGEPKRVRHFDHEQGRRATLGRYQRLAVGMGLTPEDLGDRLEVTCFPTLYFTSPGAEDAYVRELDGVDLAIFDALRGTVPGCDENDSTIGSFLNMVARVSERTGTSIVIIHHAGKPKDGHSDGRTVPRGSSAIFDACGTVLVLSGAKNQPSRVSMEKTAAEAEGAAGDDFYLAAVDVMSEDGSHRTGVRIEYRTDEQINPPKAPGACIRDAEAAVLEYLTRTPGAGLKEIRVNVGGTNAVTDAAVEALERKGKIRIDKGGKGNKSSHYLTTSGQPA